MLNIPSAIKTLFQTDGVRKNVRIHFPNGEFSDITNADIVKESLRFTESLCSQNVFKFGLAEASVLEIETVGIGNMYGMTIEAGIEIDTSSLSAATISAIVGDPGDGVIVETADSDIGYGFYRVPLGVFRVESCPRDHQAMTHRKVTAYGDVHQSLFLSPFELEKDAIDTTNHTYEADAMALIYANLGYYFPSLLDADYTKTLIWDSSSVTPSSSSVDQTETVGGHTYQIIGTATRVAKARNASIRMSGIKRNIYSVEGGWIDAEGQDAFINGINATYGTHFRSFCSYIEMAARCTPDISNYQFGEMRVVKPIPAFYPYISPITDNTALQNYVGFSWSFITDISMQITVDGVVVDSFSSSTSNPIKVYEFTPDASVPQIDLSFQPTGDVPYQQYKAYTFVDCFDMANLFTGLLETRGEFAKTDRLSPIEITALSPASPTSVAPQDYSSMWWDEFVVSQIGTVVATYLNGQNGEATASIVIGNGYSRYELTDNEALKSMSGATEASVTTLLQGDFAANAANVGFTPVELSMQGWPWMEAGDALQITAEDGTVVDTYALRIEMSGIQHLTMDITSQGGEIIGEA